MRYHLFALFMLFLATQQVHAQLHDNMWIVDNADTMFQIDFRENPPIVKLTSKYLELGRAHSVFCDKIGDLLLYTNSFQLNNKNNIMLENGDSINLGYYYNINENPIQNGSFFLPSPSNDSSCYLIYVHPEKFQGTFPLPISLNYALIDIYANNGTGKVLEKNVGLFNGGLGLNFNHAGAVRHANGRDWWIILPNRMEPKYYRILLSPEGFSSIDSQEIGFKVPTTNPNLYFGYNLFSPDGSKYADFEYRLGSSIQFFDFDRCTGLLSNPLKYEMPANDTAAIISYAGIAFSPSSRFFYLCYGNTGGYKIEQLDLQSSDVINSSQVILNCNPTNPFICSSGQPLLALNNKIYITALIDTVGFHVINQPDSVGQACDLQFGGFQFPAKYPQTEPHYFPNYRLYDIPGSACDTLGIDAPVSAVEEEGAAEYKMKIYPNPTGGEFTVEYVLGSSQSGTITILNHLGQQVNRYLLSADKDSIQIPSLPNGMYFVQLAIDGKNIGTKKLLSF